MKYVNIGGLYFINNYLTEEYGRKSHCGNKSVFSLKIPKVILLQLIITSL
jgi:hypothetical protein